MKNTKYKNINMLETNKNPLFYQRETGVTQTPFQIELIFFNNIKDGNVEAVRNMIDKYMSEGLFYGRMSTDLLTQYKYSSVCTIATANHYAALGGLDETDAYNLGDDIIMKIDKSTEPDKILDNVSDFLIDLTKKVYDSKYKADYSDTIKRCLHYIYIHLHDKITISDLSDETGLSNSYLSTLFKKEVGCTISSYIMHQKLEAAKTLLISRPDTSSIGYLFSFCTESYFISCFKNAYGITPKEFVKHI